MDSHQRLLSSAFTRQSMTKLNLMQNELSAMERQADVLGLRNEEALRDELDRVEDVERTSGVSMFQQKMEITRRLKRIEDDRKKKATKASGSKKKEDCSVQPRAESDLSARANARHGVARSDERMRKPQVAHTAAQQASESRPRRAPRPAAAEDQNLSRRGQNFDPDEGIRAARRRIAAACRLDIGESVSEVMSRAHRDMHELAKSRHALLVHTSLHEAASASGASAQSASFREAARAGGYGAAAASGRSRTFDEGDEVLRRLRGESAPRREERSGACDVLEAARRARARAAEGGEGAETMRSSRRTVDETARRRREGGGQVEEAECNVCWELLDGAALCRLDCDGRHAFCMSCLLRWFAGKVQWQCPCCKQDVHRVSSRQTLLGALAPRPEETRIESLLLRDEDRAEESALRVAELSRRDASWARRGAREAVPWQQAAGQVGGPEMRALFAAQMGGWEEEWASGSGESDGEEEEEEGAGFAYEPLGRAEQGGYGERSAMVSRMVRDRMRRTGIR